MPEAEQTPAPLGQLPKFPELVRGIFTRERRHHLKPLLVGALRGAPWEEMEVPGGAWVGTGHALLTAAHHFYKSRKAHHEEEGTECPVVTTLHQHQAGLELVKASVLAAVTLTTIAVTHHIAPHESSVIINTRPLGPYVKEIVATGMEYRLHHIVHRLEGMGRNLKKSYEEHMSRHPAQGPFCPIPRHDSGKKRLLPVLTIAKWHGGERQSPSMAKVSVEK